MANSKRIADCYASLWSRHFTWNSEMGNQLSGIAPSQILSVESYFSDLPDYEFDCRWDIFPINKPKQIKTLLVNPGTVEKNSGLANWCTFDYVFDRDLWLLTQARSLSAVNFLYFIVLWFNPFHFYFAINIFCSSKPSNLCPEGLYNQFVALQQV